MQKRIVECVPNFSEGRDKAVIHEITSAIEAVEGVKLLDVDPGEATNRTVVTFVGEPEAVLEAAFAGVKRASELIDMRNHHGAHPRMGATDVLPLIPIAGITLEECAELSRGLARRIADELHIPTYCYEAAALKPERKNLAVCRAGEYEALPEKLAHAETAPDFGARPFDEGVARTGATTVGARDFLIAVNFNLNTTSTRRANAIAFDVREKGRPVREGGSPMGKPLKDEHGNTLMQPGTLKATKAIGWFIEEYGIAQVSMNITDISVTPLHIAFDEVCRKADARGVRVTGTEIVGLVPKRALVDAGRYFLRKQQRSTGISEREIIRIAIKSMGLDDLKPFNPDEKVIEYLLEADNRTKRLVDMTCTDFAEETASESPAPGGGSISAYMGALGAALGTMVANLSAHKAGWDARWEEFSDWADKGQEVMTELLHLVDEDTAAFNEKAAVLVKQFDAIEVLPAKDGQPALMANGSLCLGENIADQGGLRVAWTAFHNSLEGKEAPAPIDGFTADQRFYLAYATLWGQNIRDEEIARLTKLDVHSLGKWRVNATLRNLQSFYDAFGITDGPMFLPESERVIIW